MSVIVTIKVVGKASLGAGQGARSAYLEVNAAGEVTTMKTAGTIEIAISGQAGWQFPNDASFPSKTKNSEYGITWPTTGKPSQVGKVTHADDGLSLSFPYHPKQDSDEAHVYLVTVQNTKHPWHLLTLDPTIKDGTKG